MVYRNTLTLSRDALRCEALDGAVLCRGTVYPWKHEYVRVSTEWQRRALPAGCYVMSGPNEAEELKAAAEYCFAVPGDRLDVIRVTGEELDCRRYICLGEGDAVAWSSMDEELVWHEENGGVCVTGCRPSAVTAIPKTVAGMAVKRLELGQDALTGICRELIISEGVAEVRLDLSGAPGLERLEYPASARLTASPAGYERTNWFRRQRSGQVYLAGWYLGTPGGTKALGTDELRLRPGTVAIADGADFKCPWRSIELPDSVRHIGRLAFADAPWLEALDLPAGLISLGEYAFQQCPRLPEMKLPRGRI